MALTRFNYQPGQYETCTDETLVPASPVLNTWYNFEIGDWKHAISDVVLKQGGLAIPTSAYELAIDTKYTAREVGESDKTIYAKWRIVDATYDEIATTVSGNNFGTYIDNAKLDSRLDALEAFDAALDAGEVPYDNSTSGLTATDVQAAIDEIQGDASKIDYDNAVSGLAATDVKAAIDEVSAADGIAYDNGTSGLAATDVQGAIDEIDSELDAVTIPSLGSEVLGFSYTGASSPQTGSLKIEGSVNTHGNAQYALVQIKSVNGSGSSCTGYLSAAITGTEAYDSDWPIVFPKAESDETKIVILMLPLGLYRVYFSGMGNAGSAITVKYKIVNSGIPYA